MRRDDLTATKSRISESTRHLDLGKHRDEPRAVGRLYGSQDERQRTATPVRREVDLARQPAA